MFPTKCEECGMKLEPREKGEEWKNCHTLYTSHISNRVLCGKCMIYEYEFHDMPLGKSLRELNEERKAGRN